MRSNDRRNVFENELGMLDISDDYIIWTSKSDSEEVKISWKTFNKIMRDVPEQDRNRLELYSEVATSPVSVESNLKIS